ncbi:hypothetical protein [Nitrospina watsonii]|nr:hypothetical protein [Nitrospina watsonii]
MSETRELPIIQDPGSFRDSRGYVFNKDGEIYRCIFANGVTDYEAAANGGIYKKLMSAGLLQPHEEVNPAGLGLKDAVYCLNHPKRLPMVSYPFEWSFSMLKDAALLHLDCMEMLIPEGFWLRDASAFNVQFDGERLRLIDTLSIGRRVPDSPWVAYRQFCSHFLAPLAVAAYCDIRTLSLWRSYIDGYPLDLAIKMLPFKQRYRPGLFMHLNLHSRFQESADKREHLGGQGKTQKVVKVSDRGLLGLVRSLRKTVEGIRWKRSSKIWEEYREIRTYRDEDVEEKSGYVEKVVSQIKPKMVWDIGGNVGEFSKIAAKDGAFVVSVDIDPACTEYLYQSLSVEDENKRILPLTMDLANPTPGLGWNNRERLSLGERCTADLTLALALIHHLVFTCNVPLSLVAEWFASMTTHLLVEFPPPEDPMVRKLLINRRGEHLPYTFDEFRSSFGRHFDFMDRHDLGNGRTLFLCKRK